MSYSLRLLQRAALRVSLRALGVLQAALLAVRAALPCAVLPSCALLVRWSALLAHAHRTDTFDHILYDTRLSCSAARVLQRGRSDHYPVEAVLHWRPLPAHQFAEAQRR